MRTVLEGIALRQRQLSPDQYEIVEVRTSRGVLRAALLIPKAVLKALCEAELPFRETHASGVSCVYGCVLAADADLRRRGAACAYPAESKTGRIRSGRSLKSPLKEFARFALI
jgi:hypothetical protein